MKTVIYTLVLLSFLYSCSSSKPKTEQLIKLSNGIVEIGILPEVGGRLVHVSLVGQVNILQADSSQWNESQEQRPSLDPKAPFKAYNGHTVWLSPQSAWWINQDSLPDLKAARSPWPPDPQLTLAPYQISDRQAHEITLVSPESPFSKVQFTKSYSIAENKVYITTMARNFSNDTVRWGLWHNTRMNGWDAVFVRADSAALLRSEYKVVPHILKPELKYADGFYSYEATQPEDAKLIYKSKSFFNVEQPLIAGHHQNQWLIIRTETIAPELIHPEQARIEIYIENSVNRASDLQELEMQFDYQPIAPGATILSSETWEILPGSGLTDKNELLDELQKKLK